MPRYPGGWIGSYSFCVVFFFLGESCRPGSIQGMYGDGYMSFSFLICERVLRRLKVLVTQLVESCFPLVVGWTGALNFSSEVEGLAGRILVSEDGYGVGGCGRRRGASEFFGSAFGCVFLGGVLGGLSGFRNSRLWPREVDCAIACLKVLEVLGIPVLGCNHERPGIVKSWYAADLDEVGL